MIVRLVIGALLTWFLYWLIHKGKINGLEATIAGLKGEMGILERQKKDLEDKLKQISEQKSVEPTKSVVKVYNTPVNASEITRLTNAELRQEALETVRQIRDFLEEGHRAQTAQIHDSIFTFRQSATEK